MDNSRPKPGAGSQHTIREELRGILVFVGALWLIFLLDLFLPLSDFGVQPRRVSGMIGIVTMPLLHGSLGHLFSNTIPLLVLLSLLAGSRANSIVIVASISVLSGLLLWAFSVQPSSNHIGASGLVYGLISYLILSGFLEGRIGPLLVSVLVLFMFGLSTSTWRGMLPQESVSWDGHLYGFVAGVVVAYGFARPRRTEADVLP